jgi:cation diffusion facilitator family transporter
MQARFVKIRNILLVVLLLNWLVAAAKIIYGLLIRSTAMAADGFHSFSDGASNLIGLIGVWVASRPKDKDHPYGHKKYETFASIIIAIVLFIISFNIIKNGFTRFLNPIIPDITAASFILMFAAIAVNTAVFLYENKQAQKLSSDILAADAQHTKSDILVSASVVFALIAVKYNLPILDPVVSILIAFFIARSGIRILKMSSHVLCDKTVMDENIIRELVLKADGVIDCHNIRTRGRIDDIHLDLHIMVDSGMTTGNAHRLNHRLEAMLRSNIKGITDISIHIEPFLQSRLNPR